MFRNWGFLLGEIWVLILLAALLGLLAGWLIFGRRETNIEGDVHGDGDAAQLRADLEACRKARAEMDERIRALTAERESLSGELAALSAAGAGAAVAASASAGAGDVDYDGDGIIEGEDEGTRPEALDGPRGGKADDLKQIKGIGPKLEILCNDLGFYHFDQVAAWTDDEVAWVNANLEGFKGRVSRDNWVEQAKVLAAGGTTEFSKRVEDGGVYD